MRISDPFATHGQHAVLLYFRFSLNFRHVEDLLVERCIDVSCRILRCWALKFRQFYTRTRGRPRPSANVRRHLDKVFVFINGKCMCLWWAVDCEREVLDVLVQTRRGKRAALKLLRNLLKKQGFMPNVFVAGKLPSFGAALKNLGPSRHHDFGGRNNNRAQNCHLPFDNANYVCSRSSHPDQACGVYPSTYPSTTLSTSIAT